MKLLNCNVQLGGTKTHSVPKEKISELELKLLRHIHGNEAIESLRQVGEIEVRKDDEYRKLARFYGAKSVEDCFEIKLDGFSEWLESTLEQEQAKRYEETLYATPSAIEPLAEPVIEETYPTFLLDDNGNEINISDEEAAAGLDCFVEEKNTIDEELTVEPTVEPTKQDKKSKPAPSLE